MTRKQWGTVKEWLLITAGIAIMTLGIYFFKFPNHFSTGGVTGISIVLGHYFPGMTPGTFVTVINVALLALGFAVFGRSFGVRTVYASLLMSGLLDLLEAVCPLDAPMTSQPLMELLFAVGLPAVGSAILFNLDASSGGTDIIAMILRKYTSLNIGMALLISDTVITLSACVAFGMETGLFSVLGLVIKALFVDMVMDNLRVKKCFQIITSRPEPIEDFITRSLHRGEQARGLRAVLRVRRVHAVQQEQIAEVEDVAVEARDVHVLGDQRRVGAVHVEERALPGGFDRHDVGERCRRVLHAPHLRAVQPARDEVVYYEAAVLLAADCADRADVERGVERLDVHPRVADGAADLAAYACDRH